MKKILLPILSALVIIVSTTTANAAVLGFDNITTDWNADIPNGYGDFQWQTPDTNSIVMSRSSWSYYYQGLVNGVTSGDYAAVTNHSGDPGDSFILTGPPLFDFISAQFSSLYFPANNISIKGYLDDVLANEDAFDVTNSTPFLYNGGNKFLGINKLVISSTLDISSDWIVMDDLTYNAAAPVPEPSTFILGLMGLGSLLGLRKRK